MAQSKRTPVRITEYSSMVKNRSTELIVVQFADYLINVFLGFWLRIFHFFVIISINILIIIIVWCCVSISFYVRIVIIFVSIGRVLSRLLRICIRRVYITICISLLLIAVCITKILTLFVFSFSFSSSSYFLLMAITIVALACYFCLFPNERNIFMREVNSKYWSERVIE